MLTTFLEQTAADHFSNFGVEVKNHCVVLPSRRAAFFYKIALQQASDKEAIELPTVYAIDDFIAHLSNKHIVDPVFVQLELYDLLQQHEPDLDFDQFITWASVLLEDFSNIDRYLVEARQLFEYMTEAKTLERWDPGTVADSPALYKHFQHWQHLALVYESLKQNLLQKEQAYSGLAYRLVAENIEQIITEQKFTFYCFIGLNGLSRSEELIINKLLKAKLAATYWDADAYYMQPDNDLKAGNFLRNYQKKWSGNWKFESNLLLTHAKEITIIGAGNATLQGKIAGQITESFCTEDAQCPTAIVLPDEHMLLPVLHSLHQNLDELNITMGLGLTGTSLYNFVELLFELHLTGIHSSNNPEVLYNHQVVIKILTHPYLARYEKYVKANALNASQINFSAQKVVQKLIADNKVLVTANYLAQLAPGHTLILNLFEPWPNHRHALQGLYHFIELFREVYKAEPNAIELEYFYLFFTLLRQIDSTLPDEREFSIRSFKRFLFERIRQTTLPFSGEPISPVQVMGMLETRALDFERLIILSVNEEVLPTGKRQTSLLPYDALRTFGLPTHQDQESLTAYYFYRLLQRAKQIYLVHVLPSDTYGAHEKSRFILQLKHDLAVKNKALKIKELNAALSTKTKAHEQVIQIEKDEATLAQVVQLLKAGISPSGINSYITCSLQFYFSRVARLRTSNTITESMRADEFGSIVHAVLEDLFKPYAEQQIELTKAEMAILQKKAMAVVNNQFNSKTAGSHHQSGMNYLLKQVAEKIVADFLKQQQENVNSPVHIIGVEQALNISLQLYSEQYGVLEATLHGLADRIDLVDDTLRIIDYKTGKVERSDLKKPLANLKEHLLTDRRSDKLRQLWLYKFMVAKSIQNGNGALPDWLLKKTNLHIVPGIYSLRNIQAGFLDAELQFSDSADLNSFIADSEQLLTQLVESILDPAQPFQKTHDLEACFTCPYTTICSRAEK